MNHLGMNAAVIAAVGIRVLLTSRELQKLLVEVLVDRLKYTGHVGAVLPVDMALRQESSTGRVEALAEGIVALYAEARMVAKRTVALRARADGNIMVFKQDLGNGTRHHAPLSPRAFREASCGPGGVMIGKELGVGCILISSPFAIGDVDTSVTS